MKRQVILSALVAIALFVATSSAEAGMFGRLSHVLKGCTPCEPAACQPCEPVACQPCEPIACQPCEPICDPCDPCGTSCYKPFRPFGGFFVNLKTKLAYKGCVTGCDPCEQVACQPCEPVCDPCEPICDPCGTSCYKPFRPFAGLVDCIKAKFAARCYTGCDPCEQVACQPCEPACQPCKACN